MSTLVGYADWIQVAACLLVLVAAARRAERAGLDALAAYAAGVGGLAGAFVGGHLLVVCADPAALTADVSRLWAVAETPKAAFGAFLGAAAGGTAVLRTLRLSVLRYADATVPAIVLGYVVYRIGCALQGCETGVVTDGFWGIAYPGGTGVHAYHLAQGWIAPESVSLPVHPVGLYYAMLGAVLYGALRRRPFGWGSGQQVLAAVGGYGLARFGLEMAREEPALAGGLTLGQWCSLAAVTLAAAAAVHLLRRASPPSPERRKPTTKEYFMPDRIR